MRVAVVGSGRIGRLHARNAAGHDDVTEVVLVGRSAERLAAAGQDVRAGLAARGGADLSVTTDLDAALAAVDVCVVATSTPSHAALTRRVAGAGLPVLVEKPLTLDLTELGDLVDELGDRPVMVGYQRRYDPGYQELRRQVRAGRLGTVRAAHATSHDHYPAAPSYLPASGGIWRDLVVHDLDLLPWVLDDRVVRLQASGAVLDDPVYAAHDDVDTALVQLTFASGALGTISALRGNGAGHDVRLEVFGSSDSRGAGIGPATPVTATDPGLPSPRGVPEDFAARFAAAFRSELDHLLRLAGGEPSANLTPPAAGLTAQRLAEAAHRSWRTGRPVDV